jgi:hypothetical protein
MARNKKLKPNSSPSPNPARLYVLVAVLVFLLGALFVTWQQRQNIFDWYVLRSYQAPAVVAQLADQDTMTPYARKVFYVNKPALESKAEFKQCKSSGEQTIVRGCYHGFQDGIYVLTVTDPRLNGVEQVTAAHEMLHAAYDRLSTKDRASIDKQLRDYFNHGLTDDRVRQTIEAYRISEPNDLTNEMHSIFGTEVAALPAPLEQYYMRYFTDRSKVTGFAVQYQAEFTTRRDAIKAYDAQLAGLKTQITNLEADLDARSKALDASSAELQRLRSSDDIAAYNAGVPGFNASVNVYNNEVAQVKALISQYNQLVSTRNAIALEAQTLTNEINSNVAPIRAK